MGKIKENFNIPNTLSLIRIVLIAPMIYYFLKDNYIAAAAMLVFSGLSDMFDGYFARKYNQITKFGAILDPVADKLTLTAVVVCLGLKFKIIMPLVIILIVKEMLMLIAGVIMIFLNKTPTSAKWYGKLATVVFYISVTVIVGLKAIWRVENLVLTFVLMSITAVLMVYALIKYFILFCKELKVSDNRVTKAEILDNCSNKV